MTDLEKGYLAAIIDGEGTVTLTKGSSFRYPTIEVSSTTLEIVEYLKDHFGGVISKKNERNPKWKQAYVWKVERRKAIALLEEIVSYLHEPKKKSKSRVNHCRLYSSYTKEWSIFGRIEEAKARV